LEQRELFEVTVRLERPFLGAQVLLDLFADPLLADAKPALEETRVVDAVARQAEHRVKNHQDDVERSHECENDQS
jgi:hypothetical protein